jgi:hypothetical protein
VLGLEPLEFVKELIEGFVRNLRSVVKVVPLLVMADLGAKLVDAGEGIHFRLQALGFGLWALGFGLVLRPLEPKA